MHPASFWYNSYHKSTPVLYKTAARIAHERGDLPQTWDVGLLKNLTGLAAVTYLARLACLPSGLYILPMFFFILFIIVVVDLGATSSQELLDESSPTFHGLVELCKGLINFAFIRQSLKGRCHGNQRNSEIFLSRCHFKTH